MEMEIKITKLERHELVDLFSTATYGNHAILIEIPEEFKHLVEYNDDDCLEDHWIDVLQKGGQLRVYDLYDDSTSKEDATWYGSLGTNYVRKDFEPIVQCSTNIITGETHVHETYFYTTYYITMETLLKGISQKEAIPLIQELFIKENGDFYTAFNLLQIAIFGEIIYG